MDENRKYTLDDIYGILSNLENGKSESCEKSMKRIKIPIPEEYGGGWATGTTQEECVRRLIERVRDQIKVTADCPTFRECGEKWFLIKMGENRAQSTIQNYKRLLNTRLYPFFGEEKIAEISPDHIQLFFNSIMHLSKSESSQCKAILCGIFDRACRNKLIQQNPMQFKYEKSTKTGTKVVLQDNDLVGVISQLDKLLSTGDIRDYLYMCFLCFTALRRGEILGLRWSDIDFENKEIHVHSNVTFPDGDNQYCITSPKDGSFGIVHLQSGLEERLIPYVRKLNQYVLPDLNDRKKPMTKSMFMKMWYRCKRTIDLKGATSHSFRASYATMMNAHCSHIDPKALQGALRHKTPDLAIKVYTKENVDKTRLAEMEYDEWISSQLKQTS